MSVVLNSIEFFVMKNLKLRNEQGCSFLNDGIRAATEDLNVHESTFLTVCPLRFSAYLE